MTPASPRARARALAAFAAPALAAIAGLWWTRPPAAEPASAPEEAFSSGRARLHVEAIARRPRPMGSAEHDRARDYLLAQLRALGLTASVQEAIASRTFDDARFARVQNVIGVKKGTGHGKALVLSAHYDSRAMTPGAADDAVGAAAILETLRAVSRETFASDVIALFTDGEEEGLLGARAFVGEHPLAKRVGLVINFEARGDGGPALLFQTSGDNGALIRALAEAAPHPAASSLAQAVYSRMPNDTDLSMWLPYVPGLNVANIGDVARYHAPTDTASHLDERTLQHHGSYALALTRAFAARTLPIAPEPAATYFNAGPLFVHYPGALDVPFAAASLVLLAVFIFLGMIRRAVHPGRALIALAAPAIASVTAGGLAMVLWLFAEAVRPDYALVDAARPALKDLWLAAFVALGFTAALGADWIAARVARPADRFAGAALFFAALGLLAAWYLPGGAFLFTWPAITAITAGIALMAAGAFESDAPAAVAAQIAAPIPAIIIFTPILLQLADAFGPRGGLGPAVLVALLASLASPAIRHLAGSRRGPIGALGVTLAITALAFAFPCFDRDYPRPDSLFFAIDADANRAFWLSADRAPDRFTSAVLDHASILHDVPHPFPLGGKAGLLGSEVKAPPEPAPEIVWIADTRDGGGRAARLRVVPPPGADLLVVRVEGGVRSARVAGIALPVIKDLAFRFFAPPPEGVEIAVESDRAGPLTVRAASRRPGFPESILPRPSPRPPDLMARPGMMAPFERLMESDNTIVARTSKK